VTLRITIDQESGIQIVRLAGWLETENLTELERVVGDTSGPFRLDLTELRSADRVGTTLLRALHAKGVSLVGASPFIRVLLGIETSRPPPKDSPTPRKPKT